MMQMQAEGEPGAELWLRKEALIKPINRLCFMELYGSLKKHEAATVGLEVFLQL
jgi:hypothetical protein